MRRGGVAGPFLPQDGCSEGHYTGSVKIQADDPGIECERRMGQKKRCFPRLAKNGGHRGVFQADRLFHGLVKAGPSSEVLNIDKLSVDLTNKPFCSGFQDTLTTSWHLPFYSISTLLMNIPKGSKYNKKTVYSNCTLRAVC